MSRVSDEYLRGVPTKPYDLVREGVIALGLIAAAIIVLAIIFKSPDAPTIRGEDVAKNHPLDYLKTATDFLSGESGLEAYGPPYTKDTDNLMKVLGFAPATILGVTAPLDAQKDLIIAPLEKVAVLNKDVAAALKVWSAASEDQQKAWTKAYSDALDKAEEGDGGVKVAAGTYGPVPVMMMGMLDLGRAGLLEGALTSNGGFPTRWITRGPCSSSRRVRTRISPRAWTCWAPSGASRTRSATFPGPGGCGRTRSGTSSR